jgi:hypothetical protein
MGKITNQYIVSLHISVYDNYNHQHYDNEDGTNSRSMTQDIYEKHDQTKESSEMI